jgi:tellurite resistance protein TehA-like permease
VNPTLQALRDALHGMYPGYFALVMSTGIVSNAFLYLGHDALSDALFWVTLVAFPVVLACFVVRALVWPAAVWRRRSPRTRARR